MTLAASWGSNVLTGGMPEAEAEAAAALRASFQNRPMIPARRYREISASVTTTGGNGGCRDRGPQSKVRPEGMPSRLEGYLRFCLPHGLVRATFQIIFRGIRLSGAFLSGSWEAACDDSSPSLRVEIP
mmetsp:Transcript_53443/g.159925  ORF Transcript_53443/g.159925 Transcript_53443/m.159925 type:complete len:128 (-) Transcript_53443:82-465(-)